MPFPYFPTRRTQPDSRAVPIVLGVTGHRDLRPGDGPGLRQAVAAILHTFAWRYRHTPLVLLSSLAQGADQLGAEVALEQGRQVIAPLPFPAAVYRQSTSFDTEEDRQRLDELLAHPQVTAFVVPLPATEMPADDAAWANLATQQEQRHRCYANAGGYVVRHCHALIALWDGSDTSREAGTAQMVQFKLSGRPPDTYPWSQPLLYWADSGPVYHIATPRANAPATTPRPRGKYTMHFPERPHPTTHGPAHATTAKQQLRQEQSQFKALCRDLDRLNHRLRRRPQADAQRVIMDLLGDTVGPVHQELHQLALLREAVSALSRSAASKVILWTRAVFGIIGLAALSFHLYAHNPFGHDPASHAYDPQYLWAFLGSLLVSFGMATVVRWRHLEAQALDYRVFAEALRVRIYWLAGGLQTSVVSNYPQQARSEISWIRHAIQACSLGIPQSPLDFLQLTPPQQLERLVAIRRHWLAGQQDYYAARHAACHRTHQRLHRTGLSLALLGWFVALLLVLGEVAPGWLAIRPGTVLDWLQLFRASHPQNWQLVVSGTLAVAGGLIVAYIEQRAYTALARQYSRLDVLFSHAMAAFDAALERQDLRTAQDILHEMGREALTEHAGWLTLRRARKFDVPVH